MKVTFLMPPPLDEKKAADRCYGCNYGIYFLPHLPTLYMVTILDNNGFEVAIKDFAANNETKSDFTKFISQDDSDVYVFFTVVLSEDTDIKARQIIRNIRDDTNFVYCGTQATWDPNTFLDDKDSFVVRGEPDFGILDVAKVIKGEKTVENARKFPVRILYEDYHTRAGACQIGVENAKGDYVAFTDADCIPERNWLENLVKEFDDGIVGVGGGIKNIGEGLWEKSINLISGTFLGSANSVQGRFFKDKRYVKSISGCNSMYHRNDIIKVGGFDVRLSTAEDTELNRKLLKTGKLL